MPAGNYETMKIALAYGADAVYLGGASFSLRAKADNFSLGEIRSAIGYAHGLRRKVYITANVFAHQADLLGVREFLEELAGMEPDGILVADPGVFSIAKEILGDIPIHISTQSNNTNHATALFWHSLGARRIVTARELSLAEIREIREKVPCDLELETFVHGAMCISYSGRCLLSSFFTGRDANQGACTHPCRWKYSLVEETRPGEYLPIEETEHGTYIMNSKDLCMVSHIPELIAAGIDSFKVEGRMKSALYVATTARAYRQAIDDYFEDPALYEKRIPWYEQEVSSCTNRTFSTGFFYGIPSEEGMIYQASTYVAGAIYLGYVEEEVRMAGKTVYRMTQRNKFSVGDSIEIMRSTGENFLVSVLQLLDEEGNMIEAVPHAKQVFYVDVGQKLFVYDILRKRGR